MRYLYLLIFLCVTQYTYSQSSYYKDVIVDRVTVNYPDHTVTAFVKPPKRTVLVREDKNYFWYSANTIQITQGGFSGKLLNGLYTAHYSNKNLKEQGVFNSGLKTGEWKTWSKEGKLQELMTWSHGLQSGRFFRYDKDGTLKETGLYKKGKLSGKITQYITPDSLATTRYKNGKTVIRIKKKVVPAVLTKPFKKKAKATK